MEFSYTLVAKPSLVAHKPAPQEGIRTADDGREVSVDVDAKGHIDLTLRANKRHNESGDLEICRILVTRLNQDGGKWSEPAQLNSQGRREEGVDCRVHDGERVLNFQVTRTCGDQGLWKNVNWKTSVNRALSDFEHANELRDAIAKKTTKPKGGIVLVLDSIETPHFTTNVVQLFRERYGVWACSLRYHAIWVVGPTLDLTYRLDEVA